MQTILSKITKNYKFNIADIFLHKLMDFEMKKKINFLSFNFHFCYANIYATAVFIEFGAYKKTYTRPQKPLEDFSLIFGTHTVLIYPLK